MRSSPAGCNRDATGRTLVVHRFYWPDSPPYASILREIVRLWVAIGVDVDVLTSQPSYKETTAKRLPKYQELDGAQALRLNLPHEAKRPLVRIANTARLAAEVFWRSASGRYSTVMVSTMPPVIPGVAARLGARISGARLIYHCMDLHPEIGRISGEFSNPLVYRILLKLDAANCAAADPVVVLSEDMERSVRARPGCRYARIRVINNFALPAGAETAPSPLPPSKATLRVLFAGNLGRFQGLKTPIAAIHALARRGRHDIELILMGAGTEREYLQRLAMQGPGRDAIHFVGHQDVASARAAMRDADCGLVSLTPEIHKYAYPSKTITYLEEGCPVIALVEEDSSLAHDIRSDGLGWVSSIGDATTLAELLQQITKSELPRLPMMSHRAVTTVNRDHSRATILETWGELLKGEEGTDAT